MRFKIISWNVASLLPTESYVRHQYGDINNFFDVLGASIVCLQETKINVSTISSKDSPFLLPPGWTSYHSLCKLRSGYCGVATYVKNGPLIPSAVYTDDSLFKGEDDELDEGLGKEGRLVVTDHGYFVLFNVYVPNSGGKERPRLAFKLRFLRALFKYMEDFRTEGRIVVLAGDLNMLADEEKDVHASLDEHNSHDEKKWFRQLLQHYIDTFRFFHPERRDAYTHWDQVRDQRGVNMGRRIDYILMSKSGADQGTIPRQYLLSADILLNEIFSTRASDHCATMVELKFEEEEDEEEQATAHSRRKSSCVKDKAEGSVVLKKCAPDKSQRSLKSFFSSGSAGAASIGRAQRGGGEGEEEGPVQKKGKISSPSVKHQTIKSYFVGRGTG